MDNLHTIQMGMIRKLTFKPGSRFSELNSEKLPSDLFSYHLRTLVKQNYIERSQNGYVLTSKGKLYSSHMDTNISRIEKLPKVSVFVIPVRENSGKDEYVIHTRKKEPYFGYSGFMTGKIRFGETIAQAAAREMEEECGLTGRNFKYHFTLHEMVYNRQGKQLEDKFFNIVSTQEVSGTLLSETEDGTNIWMDEKGIRNTEPLFHNELDVLDWFLEGFSGFREEKYTISEY